MDENRTIRNRHTDYLFTIASCVLLLYITFHYVYNEMMIGGMRDYPSHVHSILPLFRSEKWWEGWMAAPHCLWHLTTLFFYDVLKTPLEAAAAYASCVYTLFYYLVLLWVIKKVTAYAGAEEGPVRINLLALCFTSVQPLYFYWLDGGDGYYGSFSMNPLHNPTQMCVRGFAVLCFCLVIDLLGSLSDESYRCIFFPAREHRRKYFAQLAVLLFLSTVMKPTFAEVFVPAVAFYMLGILLKKLFSKSTDCGDYFRQCLNMLCCAAPALLYMLTQYLVFFLLGGSYGNGGSVILTRWLEVWKLFTDNVYLSVLLGMAFPIYMIVIDPKYFLKSIMGKLSLFSYVIGFLEAAIFGEGGYRLSHANFMWPLMSSMLLLWLTAFLRLLTLERTQNDTGAKNILINIGWALFAFHVLCGILFLRTALLGL